jgi:DNA-binding NarL/FixJ family response regulator
MTAKEIGGIGRSPIDAVFRVASLTPRCRDVLDGLLAGQSNKVIAQKLGISPRTVEVYRAQLMRKLGARHVVDVIRIAFEAILADQSAQAGSGETPLTLAGTLPRRRSS